MLFSSCVTTSYTGKAIRNTIVSTVYVLCVHSVGVIDSDLWKGQVQCVRTRGTVSFLYSTPLGATVPFSAKA